ncbi:MAG TPA: Gfo/Idh/MocA family oxidoreductase [Deinococcales bacterium]|nr:Gfo/Idh/MocA family oxidoreductase [Deinococcales bacterium]
MSVLRWGILGAANIARKALVPAMRSARGTELLAVASRAPEKARAFADELAIPRAYGSYEELLADPEIDAVYNPTPNSEHAPWTIRALRAGKHVLCEKPFTLNAAEAEEVDAVGRESGKVLMEAFMYRFHPQVERAQEVLRSGAIGELRLVRGAFLFPLTNPQNVRWAPELGGGCLYDVGCYPVNAARTFFAAEPLSASGWATPGENGVDGSFTGVLDFGEGRRASFDSSFQLPRHQRVELFGSDGVLTIQTPFTPGLTDATITLNGVNEVVPAADQYALMLEHFADVVAGKTTLRYPASEAVSQMRVLDALYRSAGEGGAPVTV